MDYSLEGTLPLEPTIEELSGRKDSLQRIKQLEFRGTGRESVVSMIIPQ